MPRTNIEQQAFTDPRFAQLGKLLKTTRYDALGRMAYVWAQATERNAYVLTEEVLNNLFDDAPTFARCIVKARLGRKTNRGIYICGTRGRIEWLANKRQASRENGKKGGRPRKTQPKPTKNRRGFRAKTPLSLAPAPAPEPALVREDDASSSAEVGGRRRAGHEDNGNRNDFPLWSEKMYRFKADKIADWIRKLTDHKGQSLRPGEEDFDVKFEAEWQMPYDYWIAQREAHEEYFIARRGAS